MELSQAHVGKYVEKKFQLIIIVQLVGMRLLATAGDKVVTHVSGASGRHIEDT